MRAKAAIALCSRGNVRQHFALSVASKVTEPVRVVAMRVVDRSVTQRASYRIFFRGGDREYLHTMWCPVCQRWHAATRDLVCASRHNVVTRQRAGIGVTLMSRSLTERLERLHLGDVPALSTGNGPPLPPQDASKLPVPLPTDLAALRVRLEKGGQWLDAQDDLSKHDRAWLKEHWSLTGKPAWNERKAALDAREAEIDRQLIRWVALCQEYSDLERAYGLWPPAASPPAPTPRLAQPTLEASA